MKVAIELFHGRTDPSDDLDGWGSQGPVFLVDYVHVTYAGNLKLGIPEPSGDGDLRYVEDLLFYDGAYYGDWSVCAPELLDAEQQSRLTEFDDAKATPPTLEGSRS